MEGTPITKVFDASGKPIAYEHVGIGDSLKILYKLRRGERWFRFSPGDLNVWLNGQPLTTLTKLELIIDESGVPRATITIKLDEIDIDADTMLALAAIIKTKEEKDHVDQEKVKD